jgi:hypothetical protein
VETTVDAALRATAQLETCIAETVGLLDRAAAMAGHPDCETVLCQLELIAVHLEELLDDADAGAQADGEALLRHIRLMCTGTVAVSERHAMAHRVAA